MTDSTKGSGSTGPTRTAAGEWAEFQVAQRAALGALVAGDPHPFQRLWEHTSEVSLLGAFGGTALGWEQVRDRLEAVAAAYADGTYEWFEYLVAEVHDPWAHTVHLESIRCATAKGEELRRRRVTKVYRHGGEGWRIVHMHADSLLDTSFPGERPPS